MGTETDTIVIVGHVDHGKSTVIGRLLLDSGSLPKRKLAELKRISRELGRGMELAYLADQLKEERERECTIDTTQVFFRTRKRGYCIVDAPGHVEFLRNMMTGATQADAAVLVVDVAEGVAEQTRRHAYLTSMLGVSDIVLVLNKMDRVGWEQARFSAVRDEIVAFLRELGRTPSHCIPASAREGTNIVKCGRGLAWYDGPSLVEALDARQAAAAPERSRFLLPVQDVYQMGAEEVVVGRVASGSVAMGESVVVLPGGVESAVGGIRVFGQPGRTRASAGESIGMVLEERAAARRGDVISCASAPPPATTRFSGSLFWMAAEPLLIGTPAVLRCATQEVACRAVAVRQRLDSSTLALLEEHAQQIGLNEVGIVLIETDRPVVVECFPAAREMGRFVIERDNEVQGAGIVR